jgi:hypothetical protein
MDTYDKVRLSVLALSIGIYLMAGVLGLSIGPLDGIGGNVPG